MLPRILPYFLLITLFLLAGCSKDTDSVIEQPIEDTIEVIGELTDDSELIADWKVEHYTRNGAKFKSNDTYRFKLDKTGVFANPCRWNLESSELLVIETYDNAGRPKEVKWDIDGFSGEYLAVSNIRTHCTLNPTDVRIELVLKRK